MKDVNSMVLKFQANVSDLKRVLEQLVKGKMRDVEKQQLGSNKHMEVSYNLLFGPTAKQQLLTNGGEPSKTREEPNKQIVGEEFDNQLVGEEISVGTKDDQCNDELKQAVKEVERQGIESRGELDEEDLHSIDGEHHLREKSRARGKVLEVSEEQNIASYV